MAKWQTVVTWEIKTIGGALLYFLFYFGIGIILTLKKLFLADYQIKV